MSEALDELIARGNRAEEAGDVARACELYRAAVALAPRSARALLNLGVALEAAGDTAGATLCYEKLLALEPANSPAHYNLGKLAFSRGDLAAAERHLNAALASRADFPEARIVLGYTLQARGERSAAAAQLKAGLVQRPDDATARAALCATLLQDAMIAHQAGRIEAAERGCEQVLEHDPQNADALHFLGALALERGLHQNAAELISRSLELEPRNAHAHFNLGRVRQAQGRDDEALACYRTALALEAKHVDALFHSAELVASRGQPQAAIEAYRKVLQYAPEHAVARCNLGNVFRALGRGAEAQECYRTAIASAPRLFEAHYNLGSALRDAGQSEEAIASFRRAVELRPDLAYAHFALGSALRDTDRMSDALACFRAALARDPKDVKARWSAVMAQLPAVYAAGEDPRTARTRFVAELTDLERWLDGAPAADAAIAVGSDQPFALAYQEENNRELLRRYGTLCTRLMREWQRSAGFSAPAIQRHDRLRVGIVSSHFRNHSVWNALTKGWFSELDRSRIALYAFDLGSDDDEQTAFVRARAEHYERGSSELPGCVEAIRHCELDVLIYPEVGMDPMTTRLASLRLAPMQAASWGHPETTGLPSIDCYLSAEDLEPPDAQAHYTERLLSLPGLGCYLERPAAAPASAAPALELGAGVPILVCPGLPLKYAPQHDWVFPEIARRLQRCRFVFFSHWNRLLSERLGERLRRAFDAQGLDSHRFVSFVPWQAPAAFLELLRRADVYLDTIGFSGFNTALQAVQCALPIVTREGRFLRGRLASGILKRLGLPELVLADEQAYVDAAVKLAADKAYRQQVARRMELARGALYEDPAPIRALEHLLLRERQGL